MATGFGMCIYKFREFPDKCAFRVGKTLECSASRSDLIQCFLDRYGAKISPDAGVRLIEELCHLILENDKPDVWEQEAIVEFPKQEIPGKGFEGK